MSLSLRNLKMFAIAFLFVALALVARNMMLDSAHGDTTGENDFGSAARTWGPDYDGDGVYPAQDCGRNYFLQLEIPGLKFPCTVRVQNPEPVNRQAIEEMQADGADLFRTPEEALDTFREYVLNILERIAPTW